MDIFRRSRTLTAVILASCAILAGFLLSPFLLLAIARLTSADWSRISDVGEAYGFASAFFSAGALVAVAISIGIQTRQSNITRQQAFRTIQGDLLRLANSDPAVYMPCFGAHNDSDVTKVKRWLFCAYRARYWLSAYETGECDEFALRYEYAPEIYGNEVSREWWAVARQHWHQESRPKRRIVAKILDEEIQEYLARTKDAGAASDKTMTDLAVEIFEPAYIDDAAPTAPKPDDVGLQQ